MKGARLRAIGANITWLAAERVIRMALGVFMLGLIARYLGTDQFGSIRYAMDLVAVFGAVATAGIEGIVIREMVRSPEKVGSILGTGIAIRLMGGGCAVLLILLSGWMSGLEGSDLLLCSVIAASVFPQSADVLDLWFQRRVMSRYTVVARIVAVVMGALLKVILVYLGAGLVWFGIAVLLDAVLSSIAVGFVFVRNGNGISVNRPTLKIGKGILEDSWPLIFSGLLVAFYFRCERFLVMEFLGKPTVGVYYAAASIADMWSYLPAMILNSTYPLLVELRQRDLVRYRDRVQSLFDALTALGYAIALGGGSLGAWFISIVFGRAYAEAAPVLVVQALMAPIAFSASARAQVLLLENKTIYHSASAFLGIGVNIALALWLMPRMGAVGAAWAALGGAWVAGFGTSLLFKELRHCAGLQWKAFVIVFRLRSAWNVWQMRTK